MRYIDGQWVKESEFLERERAKEESKKQPKPGSKLKQTTSAMERSESNDAEGDMDDELGLGDSKAEKVKKEVNGTLAEASMMSPESLEAL